MCILWTICGAFRILSNLFTSVIISSTAKLIFYANFLVFFFSAVIKQEFSSTFVNDTIEISAFNVRDKYAI